MSVGVWAAGDAAERDDEGRLARPREDETAETKAELPADVADLTVFADREAD